ncbi:M20/M25/M40 family metallo-hydrolase [Pseudonocardia adelaidensis]|uniref:M20/M25/M40 family metallo-hydrolase n=1 Tax=Pseudonocardia adelaidensis TaxID=648754 RepID=A0ABP9NRD4_9PSEU
MSIDHALLEEETIDLVRDLIRIETVNTGDAEIGDGEARAARYVATRLAEAGIGSEYVEPAPGRGNLVARIPGSDPSAGALVVHAHLDVVPVDGAWTVPPFAAEVLDDRRHGEVLYGRGAVDMKGFAGTVVAAARALRRARVVPRRDLVLAFFADEEAGGTWGAQWLVEHRRDLFDGATEAIGEVGGFSVPVAGVARRAYLLATAEKGVGWGILRARGTAGHASRPTRDSAVARIARAVAAVHDHEFPVRRTEATAAFLAAFGELTGRDLTGDGAGLDRELDRLGFVGEIARAGLRNTATPTVLSAGRKANVIPGEALAEIDTRILPGCEGEVEREVERLVGDGVEVEWRSMPPIAAPAGAPLVEALRAAVAADDPDGVVVPYLLPASTDNKNLARLGIAGYGFAPLRVPDDFDAFGMFHAVDERVPLSALRFGARVTARIFRTA